MEILVGIFPEKDNPKGYTITFDNDITDEDINKKMKEIVLSELNGRCGEADWTSYKSSRYITGAIKI